MYTQERIAIATMLVLALLVMIESRVQDAVAHLHYPPATLRWIANATLCAEIVTADCVADIH
jgi:hypothetical protein